MPGHDRSHYSGSYQSRAAAVRKAANFDPSTCCWRCGRVLEQHPKGAKWTAGHTIDGDSNAPLLPEASSCNFSAGSRSRRRRPAPKMAPPPLTRSRVWY